MAFRPNEITKEHVLSAIEKIEQQSLVLKASTRWLVEINGKRYPPKEVMRYAHEQLNGEKVWEYGGGPATNNYLLKMGFVITQISSNPVRELIERYKKRIREHGLEGELYKWDLISQFRGRPDVDKENLVEELRTLKFANLIYYVGIGAAKHMAGDRTEPFRACFKVLFDETQPLSYRIKYFNEETLKIYRELVPEKHLQHHQDERTMATYLTYHNPDKYTFFKDSFYQKYCKLIGVKAKSKNEKYVHYLELIDALIDEYIVDDSELLGLVQPLLQGETFQDSNHKLLAQDILYQMLDRFSEVEEVVGLMASDNTGWQDENIELLKNNDACIIWNSKRPSGTDDTLKFLRNINNNGRSFNLYYCSGGNVNYKATVIDFAENQQQLDAKAWDKRGESVMHYKSKFADYSDDNKKASIVFLVRDFEEINPPLPVSLFRFYNGYDVPRQDNLSPIKFDPELNLEYTSLNKVNERRMNNKSYPLNQILYGPPGTGKTFNTINRALEIIGESIEGKSRDTIKADFDKKLQEGQIVFTTFHQSMSYEDFIEGIKPTPPAIDDRYLKYEVTPGIFKRLCEKASEKQLSNFNDAYNKLITSIVNNDNELMELKTPTGKSFYFNVNSNNNLNLHTGTERKKQGVVTAENLEKLTQGIDVFRGWEGYANSILNYLKSECQLVVKENKKKANYVLIIDEINRGNVSQIFGELITLIEENKRMGRSEALEVTLPYSKGKFSVPSNLYIIGTMNTADRSVEALDAALRRRFSFEEMSPQPELVSAPVLLQSLWIKYADLDWVDVKWKAIEEDYLKLFGAEIIDRERYEDLEEHVIQLDTDIKFDNVIKYSGIQLDLVLRQINKRIEKLLDRDHQIGHSYFMEVGNIGELKSAFQNKIIPLLQEYFFGDYGKIGLVLGSGFVETEVGETDNIFAEFTSYDGADFSERPIHRIKNVQDMSEESFIYAINTLSRK